MTKVFRWKVDCTPFERGSIRSMSIDVVASSRKEAELIVLDKAHKFFDQDMHYVWNEPIEGYIND